MAFKMRYKGFPKTTGDPVPKGAEGTNIIGGANVETLSKETLAMARKLNAMTAKEKLQYKTRLTNNTGDPGIRAELALFNKANKVGVK